MARIETDPFYTAPTFSRATAATDLFKKEDVQALAAAMSTHDHSTGKGAALGAASIPNGTITSAMIADLTIDTADLKDGAVTSAKIADGTIATADLANQSVTNAKLGTDTARLNLLVNGGFEIWQRGNGPFTATGVYTADRWFLSITSTDTFSVSKDTANADAGAGACAAVTFGLVGGGGNSSIYQKLVATDYTQLKSRVLSASYRVRCATANAVRIGIFDGSAWQFSALNSGSGSYQTLTVTTTLGVSGDYFTGIFFSASCTAYIDNAMLVVGSVPADYAPLHPADDLARCLRYYETMDYGQNSYIAAAQAFNTTQAAGAFTFSVQKAVTPTLTMSTPGTFGLTSSSFAIAACTAVTVPGSNLTTARSIGFVATASGLVAGNATVFLVPAGQSAKVILEANP